MARKRHCAARVGEEGKLFGSVTTQDIADQLAAQGFTSACSLTGTR